MACCLFQESQIESVAHLLKTGAVISFPTETVYGLGADVTQIKAIQRVYALKSRPKDHPVIIHIDNPIKALYLCDDIPESFWKLAKAFWPGPLTIVLKKSKHVSELITGGHDTVAIRIPDHPMTLELLKYFRKGLIGPSANPFGKISPTEPEHVIKHLGSDIDGVLSGGRCQVGIESTVVYLTNDSATILRKGLISQNELEQVLGIHIIDNNLKNKVPSPGTHKSHYSPNKTLLMLPKENFEKNVKELLDKHIRLSGFGIRHHKNIPWITMPTSSKAYAQKLYQVLHELDKSDCDMIVCERPPLSDDIWQAVYDRLNRASQSNHIMNRNSMNDDTSFNRYGIQV